MGEYQYGKYPSEVNMIVVRVGRGIGAGIIINGQIFPGDSGYAGEIGHVVCVHSEGLPCRCGNSGCLETVSIPKLHTISTF
jgi:predicted NBD/HSP70 family sugar kinase